MEEAGVELVVEGASEDEDALLGVEVPVLGAARRKTAGLCSLGLEEEASCSDVSEDSASSTSTSCSERASPSASSRPLG